MSSKKSTLSLRKLQKKSKEKVREKASTQTWKSVHTHTYTPQSHADLLRNFSKMSNQQTIMRELRQENERLAQSLEDYRRIIKLKDDRIKVLEICLNNTGKISQKSVVQDLQGRRYQDSDVYVPEEGSEDSGEKLSSHFSEVMRRHHELLAKKDQRIQELEAALEQCRCRPEEAEVWSHNFHSAIEDERLRRSATAVKVFAGDLDLLKTQLQASPLSEAWYAPTTPREKLVLDELQRRENVGVVADIERMGRRFLDRLDFEEKLDKMHWKIETGRMGQAKCSYNEEFEMLEITRNNLLKALSDLRAKNESNREVKFGETVTISTNQSFYHPECPDK